MNPLTPTPRSQHRMAIVLTAVAALTVAATSPSSSFGATVFSTDFESGVPGQFSGAGSTAGTEGYSAFGFGSTFLRNTTAGSTILTLTGLPEHTSLSLGFSLAIIDSWDGSTFIGGAAPSDFFSVRVDGVTLFSHTFDNFFQSDQTAPTANTISFGTQLGFTGTLPGTIFLEDGTRVDGPITYSDSAYNMGHPAAGLGAIPHTGSSVTIEFFAGGPGWQGGADESWAIDNLNIVAVPEPSTIALVALGLGGLALRRRLFGVSTRRRLTQ